MLPPDIWSVAEPDATLIACAPDPLTHSVALPTLTLALPANVRLFKTSKLPLIVKWGDAALPSVTPSRLGLLTRDSAVPSPLMRVPFLIVAVPPESELNPPAPKSPALPTSSVLPVLSSVPVRLTTEPALRVNVPKPVDAKMPPRLIVLPLTTLIVPLLLQLGAVVPVGAIMSVVPVPVADTTPLDALVKLPGPMFNVPCEAVITPVLLMVVVDPLKLSVFPTWLASSVPALLMMSAL